MLDELTSQIIKERNKLVDKCTLDLLNKSGVILNDTNSNMEIIMAMDDLQRRNCEIKFTKSYDGKDRLCLYKNGVLEYGYEFDIRVDEESVKLISILIK